MATDRHLGRGSPTFVIKGKPDKYIGLIQRHGVYCRIRRARKCPCLGENGQPNLYCDTCGGEGEIYDFQRKLLQAEEDSDVKGDRSIVLPFRVPIIDVLKVERLLPPEQGGIKRYKVEWFDSEKIKISGEPLPQHFHQMRVSYYFDRFVAVRDEFPEVVANTKTLILKGPVVDDGYNSSNILGASGDIVMVQEIRDLDTKHVYKNYKMSRNRIYLAESEPTPRPLRTIVTYSYCPLTRVLPSDIQSRDDKENWITMLPSGKLRLAFEPWYEVGSGDLFTILSAQFWRDEVISHSATGQDKLLEFDVGGLAEEIIGKDQRIFRRDRDYIQYDRNRVKWIGDQPAPGEAISVRYSYYPTYRVFDSNPEPNTLENQFFAKIVYAALYSKTQPTDVKTLPEERYTQEVKPADAFWRPQF